MYNNDDDDVGFGNRGTAPSYSRDDEDELKKLQMKIGQIENQSLASTQRALRSLNEATETGTKTAEELVRQGEQLNKIDSQLDDIDNTLTSTQKNINKVTSIFGGIKNKFMGRSSVQKIKNDTKPRPLSTSKSTYSAKEAQMATSKSSGFEAITGSEREKELNQNLDEMSIGLKNLNALALDMKFELDRHNPVIERITNKSDMVHTTIEAQDKQMKRIK